MSTKNPPTGELGTARLREGVHLFPSADGREWLLAEPGERFTRLLGPATVLSEVLSALQPELHGGRSAVGVPADLRAGLLEALARRGVLTDPTPRDHPAPPRIQLDGSGPVAEVVHGLLTSWAEVIPDPVGGDAAPDLRITCAPRLTDREFQRRDEESLRSGTPWHHCHVEGTSLAIGPFQLPGGARYRDWRGRRLAASTTPTELEAYWAHLDSTTGLPDDSSTSAGMAAVAAGLLVDDVQRWWRARERPRVAVEHVVGRDELGAVQVSRHPVLPLPIP